MIATFITATVLAATVTGGLGVAETRWPCPRALAQLPDHVRRWIPESLLALAATGCRTGRPETAGSRSPETPDRIHRPAAPPPFHGSGPESPARRQPAPEHPEQGKAEKRKPEFRKPELKKPEPGKPGSGKSEPSRRQPRRPDRPSPGQIAVAAALRQVGTPYVWGGGSSTGPTRGGFDCSGLALHAWAKAGVTLTHYTGTQFRQGHRVPFSQLRPGDLVFFGGGAGAPAHVGLYVKNGVMVHAPKTGDVVKTTAFADSPYYRARYRGAVRPSPR
ncbi:hypothetical protein GCM10010156_43690 [Planobispora rosea]|uniref:NlpC/P60 domain-containing protein n=1 Tax=Planobispora rosea TaxID=35762 RepID=A0A8J3S4G7_PLARO|nr:C40 family peptidase [Planobispora rosea]GGS80123.1 hypothetical protein GCM10010156_43690 [Planobispora rosea]GIH85776.1 hypothetical protein Pro02_41840 [Planobispora rosea]